MIRIPNIFLLDHTNMMSQCIDKNIAPSEWKSVQYQYHSRKNEIHLSSIHHSLLYDICPPLQGHCEFFICDSKDQSDPEGTPNQGCFNMHPLTRNANDGDASPIDPNYPGRYYVDPPCREDETDQTMPDKAADGYVITMKYDLPKDLSCEHCILQMVYCECFPPS